MIETADQETGHHHDQGRNRQDPGVIGGTPGADGEMFGFDDAGLRPSHAPRDRWIVRSAKFRGTLPPADRCRYGRRQGDRKSSKKTFQGRVLTRSAKDDGGVMASRLRGTWGRVWAEGS